MGFYENFAFCAGYLTMVIGGIWYVVSVFFTKIKHRHKLDPQDLRRVDDDSVEWFCWDCEKTITASCGLNICAGNDVVKRPSRSGDLWG
jgi:hypothetical protein